MPIPIVRKKGKWSFDLKTGREEILYRRIGSNELDVIGICRGFVQAQRQYAQEKHDDSKVNQYAQNIISSPGKHDGLAWQNADGTWGGPVGPEVANVLARGMNQNRDQRYQTAATMRAALNGTVEAATLVGRSEAATIRSL